MYSPAATPPSVLPAPAKNRRLSTVIGISSRATAIGLPTLADSSAHSSSPCRSSRSARARSARDRSPGVVSRHPRNAAFAAATARSTSAWVPSGTSPMTSPSAGLRISRTPPSTAPTRSPATRLRDAFSVMLNGSPSGSDEGGGGPAGAHQDGERGGAQGAQDEVRDRVGGGVRHA